MGRAPIAIVAIVAIALFAPASAHAQKPAPAPAPLHTMTLDEALTYAHAHQPVLAEAKARIEAAQANAKIPGAQWTPSVGALAQLLGGSANNTTASYTSDPLIDIPRIGGTPSIASSSSSAWKPYTSSFVGVGVQQEIFDFGRIAAQRVSLETFVDVERYRADADRLDIDLGVREAYYAVLGAKAVVDAADGAYARAKIHRDVAKAGVDNQLWPQIKLARAEADLARFDVGRIRAQGGLDLARSVLAAAIGSPEAHVDAAGTMPDIDVMPSLDAAIADASKRDPVLKEALAEVKAQEAETTAIGAEMRPNVFFSATLSGRAGGAPSTTAGAGTPVGDGFLPVVPNWDIGIVLTIPLLDGVVGAREDASKAKEDAARAELDLRKSQELAQIQQTYRALVVAKAQIPALEQSLAAAKINYDQADAMFKGGLATSVEVADAEAVLADAEIELALGRFELARARAVFGRAIAEGL
jgi:outer membrane protein TolC